MHRTFGCLVAGRRQSSPCAGRITLHHVRHVTRPDGTVERTGRIDRRSVMVCEAHHQHGHGPHAVHVMTAPGAWERFFGVDWEQEIARYNAMYEAEATRA